MPSVSHRLDRFIASRLSISKKSVRDLLVRGKVMVDGETSHMMNQVVSRFTYVMVDGEVLQIVSPLTSC